MTINELTAGQKLDVLVAEKVMGWMTYRYEREGLEHTEFVEVNGRGKRIHSDWHPSTDIAAAWQVMEKLKARVKSPGYVSVGTNNDKQGWDCTLVERSGEGGGPTTWASTAPLAICLAALKAVELRPD